MTPLWMEFAACRGLDPELFYAEGKGSGVEQARRARKICSGCPARKACLDYALENNEQWGIWGGMTVRDRQKYRKVLVRGNHCADCGCEIPRSTNPGPVQERCKPCASRRRRHAQVKVRAAKLGVPILACPDCGEPCAGDHGIATHRALSHGTPGMSHYRYPSTGEPA